MDLQAKDLNIDQLFGNTIYYIDFYQREYKWNKDPVEKLLDDVWYKFGTEYEKHKGSDVEIQTNISNYGWYYMNTFVINEVDGKCFVADGQQRLTALSLILIKLYHLALQYNSQRLGKWIDSKISGFSGFGQNFWMNHTNSLKTIEAIYQTGEIEKPLENNVTSHNIVTNYSIITNYINKQLAGDDIKKFEAFVFYFLKRIRLICLNIEQVDVPMVFEVINDRGVRLKPYEILKGKLLGQIDKNEMNQLQLNELWDRCIGQLNSLSDDEADQFFIYYLKSKYAKTRGEARKFDNDYHRSILRVEELGLEHNDKNVKRFLLNDFNYYSHLYYKVRCLKNNLDPRFPHVYYNGLTQMDTQYLLVLSACKVNDPEEDEKIERVAYEVDRLFTLMQLQRCYNSNLFATKIYEISNRIKNGELRDMRSAFDDALLVTLKEVHVNDQLSQVWNYGLFRNVGYDNLEKRFMRYVLARVELYIAMNTKLEMKRSLYDLVINRGGVCGFHIEHILADNSENHELFDNNEELFRSERNRLGGLLLMKGYDNEAAGNEPYSQKLRSYANTLYWNETLREDSYKSKLDFTRWIANSHLNFKPYNVFGPQQLEERHRLLFEIVEKIWE